MVKLNWTPQAKHDLIAIAECIAQDSKKYARIQIQRLRDRTRQLSNFPESGRVVPEFEDIQVREVISSNYRIIYRLIPEERIDILTIHHSSRRLR